MKILFLDFDGVLNDMYPNSEVWSTSNPNIKEISDISKQTSNFIYNVVNKYFKRDSSNAPHLWSVRDLDCNKIELLNWIVSETDCKIVFSTAWRNEGTENLAFLLTLKGFNYPDNCISCTPHLTGGRGLEIQEWLEHNAHLNIESFVIVDDEDFDIKEYFPKNTIKVRGLNINDAEVIINMLK